MKRVTFTTVALAISISIAYWLGPRFGYPDFQKAHWIVLGAALLATGIVLRFARLQTRIAASCLLGFVFGWLISVSTIGAHVVATHRDDSYGLIDAAEDLGLFEILLYVFGIALVQMGWLPFVVLFASVAYMQSLKESSQD